MSKSKVFIEDVDAPENDSGKTATFNNKVEGTIVKHYIKVTETVATQSENFSDEYDWEAIEYYDIRLSNGNLVNVRVDLCTLR